MNIMPRRDGTGPVGKGTMTGRQMGPCKSTSSQKGPVSPGRGMGRGMGRRGLSGK
jgi:hypothetical protein